MSGGNAAAVTELAECLIAARKTGQRLTSDKAAQLGADLDRTDAYAVQARVCETFGPAVAFKTGRKTPDAPVIKAPILDGALRISRSKFRTSEVASCGVELEIGFRLDRPLPPCDSEDFAAVARSCVTAMPVIEIVNGRVDDFATMADVLKLADNQINGGLVWAEPMPDGSDLDFLEPHVELRFNGEPVVSGRYPVPGGGGAFEIFLAFAKAIGGHCGGLQPGQIVTTGSLTGMIFVEPGTRIEGHISGLGTVETAYA